MFEQCWNLPTSSNFLRPLCSTSFVKNPPKPLLVPRGAARINSPQLRPTILGPSWRKGWKGCHLSTVLNLFGAWIFCFLPTTTTPPKKIKDWICTMWPTWSHDLLCFFWPFEWTRTVQLGMETAKHIFKCGGSRQGCYFKLPRILQKYNSPSGSRKTHHSWSCSSLECCCPNLCVFDAGGFHGVPLCTGTQGEQSASGDQKHQLKHPPKAEKVAEVVISSIHHQQIARRTQRGRKSCVGGENDHDDQCLPSKLLISKQLRHSQWLQECITKYYKWTTTNAYM